MEITKAEMLQLYADDLVRDVINVNDRVYAKVDAALHATYGKTVWCSI